MDALGTGPSHLVGWSDGGNIGLLVAMKRPDLVRKVVTMGANFSADGLMPEALAAFTPGTSTSAIPMMQDMWKASAVEPERFDVVLDKMLRCWNDYAIPAADLARIEAPVLVMVGDDDIIRFEHTITLYEAIPDAQLAVIPGASHLAPIEKAGLVNQLVLDFVGAEGPADTMMPLRRT
jgi:pimeloyl-ACP methyl ester carboxylesterase